MTEPPGKRQKSYPSDWPVGKLKLTSGHSSLNLNVEDLPHESSGLEWWYFNSHLSPEATPVDSPISTATTGMAFALFRLLVGDTHVHCLVFSAVNPTLGLAVEYTQYEDCLPPEMWRSTVLQLLQNFLPDSDHLHQAYRSQLDRLGQKLPLPDRVIRGCEFVINSDQGTFDLRFGPIRFQRLQNGDYNFISQPAPGLPLACQLSFHPTKPPFLHNKTGVVSLGLGEDQMFYYSLTRNQTTASINWQGQEHKLHGSTWYDHEFGRDRNEPLGNSAYDSQWLWGSAMLDNGWEVTASLVTKWEKSTGRSIPSSWLDLIDPAGVSYNIESVKFIPGKTWVSLKTAQKYQVEFDTFFQLPAELSNRILGVTTTEPVRIRWVALEDREVMTAVAQIAFYESHAKVELSGGGTTVHGRGFIEDAFSNRHVGFDDLLRNTSEAMFREADLFFPVEPTLSSLERLLRGSGGDLPLMREHVGLLKRSMTDPFNDIFRRGGKAWRAFALTLTLNALQFNPESVRPLLILPELLHTGSLIVDDVEDRSLTRRGGPAAHCLHGEPLAINAGCAAYFYPHVLISEFVPPAHRLEIHELLAHALRSAHLGQGLDILTVEELVRNGLKTGDFGPARGTLRMIYSLKSGLPVQAAGRISCVLAGASEALKTGFGNFWREVGTSFQIVDDVLNLRGFEGNLKDRGEDLAAGKFTLPVIDALERMPESERLSFYEAVKKPNKEQAEIEALIQRITELGALQASTDEADQLLKSAWDELEVHLPETYAKAMLQAFLHFLIQRHY